MLMERRNLIWRWSEENDQYLAVSSTSVKRGGGKDDMEGGREDKERKEEETRGKERTEEKTYSERHALVPARGAPDRIERHEAKETEKGGKDERQGVPDPPNAGQRRRGKGREENGSQDNPRPEGKRREIGECRADRVDEHGRRSGRVRRPRGEQRRDGLAVENRRRRRDHLVEVDKDEPAPRRVVPHLETAVDERVAGVVRCGTRVGGEGGGEAVGRAGRCGDGSPVVALEDAVVEVGEGGAVCGEDVVGRSGLQAF